MEAAFGHHIHAALQEILYVHQQPSERQTRAAWCQRHQQIDIAVGVHVAPCHGTEHPHVAYAMTLGQRDNFGAVGLDERVHSQAAFSVVSRMMLFFCSSAAASLRTGAVAVR